MTGINAFDDDMDDSLRELLHTDAQLPEKGPPVDKALLRRLAAKQLLDTQVEKRVFMLITAYSDWHTAFLDAQLKQLKDQIRMSN